MTHCGIDKGRRMQEQKVPRFKSPRHRHADTPTRNVDLKTLHCCKNSQENGSKTGREMWGCHGFCHAWLIIFGAAHPVQGRIQMGGNIFFRHLKDWPEMNVTEAVSVVSIWHLEGLDSAWIHFLERWWILMRRKLLSVFMIWFEDFTAGMLMKDWI